MKKKVLAVLMTGVIGMGLLAGCGNGSSEEKKGNSGNGDEKVEITFWDNYADTIHTEVYEKIISDFEKENPDISVKYVPLPSDQAKSKYDVAIQGNTTPDCGVIYQYWMNDFVVQDALLPLDEYTADDDSLLDTFVESMKSTAPDGKYYSLPFYVVPPALWYNTEMFEEKGVKVPTTWDEVFEDVPTLTDKEKGVYGFSIRGGAGSSQQLEQMLYQYSGITEMFDEDGKSTINDPKHVEFLEKFAALYNKYTPESDITNASTEMISAFDSGSAAMIFHNIGSYGQHRDTLGEEKFGAVVNLKSVDDTNVMVSNGVASLSVFKNSKHPEEAYKFIQYLTEHTANSYFNETLGSIPTNKEALADEWVQNSAPVKAAADMLLDPETKIATLPVEVTGYFDLHTNTLAKDFQNVLLGNESAKDYLDNWANKMTELKKTYDENVANK
ncbi:ABC transporter substrate-binding protein [Mediterraneibacter gnavus]|uniref:ABC transporter substrate-binding protein n=1 Tax=Mediterraneibacter gnavus TaxID=33038 RepID=UPI0032BFB0A0